MKRERFKGEVRCSRFSVSSLVPGTLHTLKREQQTLAYQTQSFAVLTCAFRSHPLS
jgi:hypothetical protein